MDIISRQQLRVRCRVGPTALTAALLSLISLGSAMATVRRVPQSYPTIQAGIDASAPGDTVLLSPGTYRGPGNRDVEFPYHGDFVIIASDGPEATIMDCEQAGRGFLFTGAYQTRATRIEGLTIENGVAPGPNPQGGAISNVGSSPTIVNCRFLSNQAYDGGALYLNVFAGVLERCVISGNRCTLPYGFGGGIFMAGASFGGAEFIDCVITNNVAFSGAGCAVTGTGLGPTYFRGCTITGNTGVHVGGIDAIDMIMERPILWGNCGEQFAAHADIRCSDVDTSGVDLYSGGYQDCVFTDPLFCSPSPCGEEGDWTLRADSPCLPEHSPCGTLIGALGMGCSGPIDGACCLPNGSCVVLEQSACDLQQGTYQGDGTLCDPNPCEPTRIESTTWGRVKARFGASD